MSNLSRAAASTVRRAPAAFLCLAVLPAVGPAQELDPVAIDEWTVPWPDTRPRDPYVGPDGSVWFVGQTGDYIARLDPIEGTFERRDLQEGTGPHNLIVSPDGTVFIAGNRRAEIQILRPGEGVFRILPMPDPAARDPHTLAFGPDGTIWFTVQNGNFVGRLRRSGSEQIALVEVPTPASRPYGIEVAPDGRPWFVEFAAGKIGTVDPGSLALTEYSLPRPETRPRRISLAADGGVWYVDFAGGILGRLDPVDGSVREWPTPGGETSRPYALAGDRLGRLWFVETGSAPNRLVGFDPSREEFFSVTPIPSGGGSVRHMVFDRPAGVLWFGTDGGTIGRAHVVAAEDA